MFNMLNSNDKASTYNKGSKPQYQLRPFVGSTNQQSVDNLLSNPCGAVNMVSLHLSQRNTSNHTIWS